MGRIWESINASNQHMLTHVPNGQIAGSPLCQITYLVVKRSKFNELYVKFFVFLLNFLYLKSPHLLTYACKLAVNFYVKSLLQRI